MLIALCDDGSIEKLTVFGSRPFGCLLIPRLNMFSLRSMIP